MANSWRVLYVVYGGFLGGAERSILDCAAALARNGEFDVLVACTSSTAVWDKAVEQGLQTFALRFPVLEGLHGAAGIARSASGVVSTGLCLRQMVQRQHVNLVHANGVKAVLPAVVGAKLAGAPLVFHARDYPRQRALHRIVSAMAAATIVPSRFIGNAMPSSRSKLHVVPNGVDFPPLRPAQGKIRKSLGLDPQTVVITTVAQLVPWKRQDLFLEAAAIVAQRHAKTHFCLVGSDIWQRNGNYQEALRRLAAAPSLVGKVTFLGHCSDVGDIISDSDILVLPSDNEPFGRVVVEAWHYGAAMVSADGSGPEEIIENGRTGYLFRRGSAADLATVLERLISDPSLRNRCCLEGYKQCGLYPVERCARAVSDIYRGILQ